MCICNIHKNAEYKYVRKMGHVCDGKKFTYIWCVEKYLRYMYARDAMKVNRTVILDLKVNRLLALRI